jgi:hypothetical protein
LELTSIVDAEWGEGKPQMNDDAFRFGSFTEQVKDWLRVGRFPSASMVVYLRFNCRFSD